MQERADQSQPEREPLSVLEKFNQRAGQPCISSITLAELHHGVEKTSR